MKTEILHFFEEHLKVSIFKMSKRNIFLRYTKLDFCIIISVSFPLRYAYCIHIQRSIYSENTFVKVILLYNYNLNVPENVSYSLLTSLICQIFYDYHKMSIQVTKQLDQRGTACKFKKSFAKLIRQEKQLIHIRKAISILF